MNLQLTTFVNRAIKLLCLYGACMVATSERANADIVWNYLSTDGTDVVTGQLITAGDLATAFQPGLSFALLSIENTFLNGSEQTDWFLGMAPPFDSFPVGAIVTTDSAGNGEVDPTGMAVPRLEASDSLTLNSISLAIPGGAGGMTESRLNSGWK